MHRIALRIDDIGASTKIHERYAKKSWQNIGVLRDRRLFGAWGPYREMTSKEWNTTFSILEKYNAKLTVAVTATWVEQDGTLTPFPDKFPEELGALKTGLNAGLIEIACHGLTHCVLQNRFYLPKLTGNNRKYHREFWDWLPDELHHDHLEQSLDILNPAFGCNITVLVPPGNVYADATVDACRRFGIKTINCSNPQIHDASCEVEVLGNDHVLDFHDREIVLHGTSWLNTLLEKQEQNTSYLFISEL